MKNRNL